MRNVVSLVRTGSEASHECRRPELGLPEHLERLTSLIETMRSGGATVERNLQALTTLLRVPDHPKLPPHQLEQLVGFQQDLLQALSDLSNAKQSFEASCRLIFAKTKR